MAFFGYLDSLVGYGRGERAASRYAEALLIGKVGRVEVWCCAQSMT
jgi:hypothetical protein